jgi:hypothetical protein
MACDILNLSTSSNLQDRLTFEVDAKTLTPEMLCDLEGRLHDVTSSAVNSHLFDSDFHPFASIQAVLDPLKFEVCYLPFYCRDIHRCSVAWHSTTRGRPVAAFGFWVLSLGCHQRHACHAEGGRRLQAQQGPQQLRALSCTCSTKSTS